MYVDANKNYGDFWLTGSQAFHLMNHVSESLVGRVGIVQMLGLSTAEIYGCPSLPFSTEKEQLMNRLTTMHPMDIHAVFQRITRGSMPALYENPEIDWQQYYASYVHTYLLRDIKELTQVADEMQFFNFMTVIAARTARPVMYEEIANEVGVSAPTIKKWISILRSSSLIALVQPYSHNMLKRVTKMPLLHFLDIGLCAYLLRWPNAETLEIGPMAGQFFESYIFSEIYKSFCNTGIAPPIYYYRDKDKRKIDLLLYQNGVLTPIEVKKSVSPPRSALKNFHVLDNLKVTTDGFPRRGQGAVICMADDVFPLDAENLVVPAWLI